MATQKLQPTRALQIYPSHYPIPSPYVLAQGVQETEGLCPEYLVANSNNCTSYIVYNSTFSPIEVFYIDCNGIEQSRIIEPDDETSLGCAQSVTPVVGVSFYNDGPCGPPALIEFINCSGSNEIISTNPNEQNFFCASTIISLTGGYDAYYEETGGNCGSSIPYTLQSNTVDFIANGVSPGDIVYVFDDGGYFNTTTKVIGIIGANTIQVGDYINVNYNFTIYQQSAMSGLGNQGCVLYIGQGGTLNVTTSGNDVVTFFNIKGDTFFPVNVLNVTIGTDCSNIIALW